MDQTPTILQGYSDEEKGAYLGAIASLATADKTASEEEIQYIEALAASAALSEEQEQAVKRAATELSGAELERCLEVLKSSELRFSLVSDLIAFSQSDANYSEEEKQSVAKMAGYLGVNKEQFSLLDQFTKKAVQQAPAQAEQLQAGTTTPGNFFGGLGFGEKLKGAGINTNALLKGGLAVLGPIILAQMFRGGRRRSGGLFGGNATTGGGGLLGGLLGGGGMGRALNGGGLFDILGGGHRGFGNAGGLLGKILGGRY